MLHINDVIDYLSRLAPLSLAETWDNVGLLIGDRSRPVQRVMTCLTVTEDVVREAVERGVHLIVSHHPVLFRPVQKLTADEPEGRLMLMILEAKIAVYSPHTGYDNAEEGINRQLAEQLELTGIQPLRPLSDSPPHTANDLCGGGRCGTLPQPLKLSELLDVVKDRLAINRLQFTGNSDDRIERLGIACGSAAEFIRDAVSQQCQALLLGEARFHSLLEAESVGLALILVGHYASERPAVERLADTIGREFASLEVWASANERDPLRWT